jgi:broad specificity phosphatase PhoE
MRILIIRHGDPDYSIDSLTEKGWREAELLSQRLMNENISKIYCSPLGRAKDTARPTLEKTGMDYEVLEWLREFPVSVTVPYAEHGIAENGTRICPWNLLPQYWTHEDQLYDNNKWSEHDIFTDGRVQARLEYVTGGWNSLLLSLGYRRDGQIYRFDESTDQNVTVALFCHLGLGLSLLSQLTRVSLPLMWHTFFMPTSSVTTILMEKHSTYLNEAHARVVQIGDTSHLYGGGEPVSQSGLFSPIK